jgi:hypothetical protein
MVPPANLDDLSHAELKNLVVVPFEQVAELRRTIAAQAEEIARLKGGPRRPNIKPSGMEKATEAKPDKPAGACRSGQQHLSDVLYGTLKGRRFTLYIPEDLVPEVRCCLDNGGALAGRRSTESSRN